MKKLFEKIKSFFSFFKLDVSLMFIFLLAIILNDILLYCYYFIFIILHELCHLIVAKKLGYLPKQLRISFFGASLEGYDDFLLSDEIKIVFAGPIFNFFVVIICYLCFWFYPESFEILNDVLIVNKSILIFNLIPIFPLDAGRLVLCFLSKKIGRNKAVKLVKKISIILIFALFAFSIFAFVLKFSFTLGFAAINLCVLLFESVNGTSYKREIFFDKKFHSVSSGLPEKIIFVKDGVNFYSLLKFIDAEHYFKFVFIDENFNETRQISEYELMKNLGFI